MAKEEVCDICGKSVNDYDKTAECKENHNWRKKKNFTPEQYARYRARRKKSLEKTHRKRLDALNKKTPEAYKNRKGGRVISKKTLM